MPTYKLNDAGDVVKKIQTALKLTADGQFGAKTEAAVKEFQKSKGLVADGIVGPQTLEMLLGAQPAVSNTKGITEAQYAEAAALIGCEVAAIKAVDEVESSGAGFLDNGDVKILFEPHIFWRELVNEGIKPSTKVAGNEDILYEKWKSGAYGPISKQWDRMNRACKINEKAALESASYGKFQILGNNYKACGFKDVFEMVDAMKASEYNQLKAFVNFVKNNNLAKHLVNKAWAEFARGYNGSSYKENKYDTKLEAAYKKYK